MNYLDVVADRVRDELAPSLRPDADGAALYRLYALLVLAKGNRTTLKDVHDAWSTWMAPRQPDHAALIPFTDLTDDQQEQDRPYLEAILRVASAHVEYPKDK